MIERINLERSEKWREAIELLPFIKLDHSWSIKVIPPFGGAIARFLVSDGDNQVSVYADFTDQLGFVGQPYWEIHPFKDDTFRCLISETESLIDAIRISFADRKNEPLQNNN